MKKSEKIDKTLAHIGNYSDICNALHLNQATESPTATAAGLFYGRGSRYITTSSVPCGALMRPLPGSRCNATGSGTFSVSPREQTNIQCFI